eukprot:TRINITY_DN3861_c0_g1_i4.p1 TRINITY_DN3861_c0_g1~~TRINITY_DN3861_c0_g1_i4.p1  ORF type:complete len:449 (+),score=106.02 TRINITY_DN3861_c0_g1_i4:88-1434(+)
MQNKLLGLLLLCVSLCAATRSPNKKLFNGKETVPDCCCDTQTISHNYNSELHDVVQRLRKTTFFRIFKVNLNGDCPFAFNPPTCSSHRCSVFECPDEQIPETWKIEDQSQNQVVPEEHPESTVNREINNTEFSHWVESDDSWINQDNSKSMSYIDLQLNPEGYTGFEGFSAHSIWKAIYAVNCFQGISDLDEMCFEQRVFYRIVSGLHAAIAAHIANRFPVDPLSDALGRSVQIFQERLGRYPDRVKNLYFVFVFLSRAVNKAADIIRKYDFTTGHEDDDLTRQLVQQLVDTNAIQSCSASQSFDESAMFRSPDTLPLKAEFQKHFRNISRIIDCVGCEKCRLHGKLQILGIGTALKILFSDAQNLTLQRNEVIALINTLGKFSHAINIVQSFTETEQTRENIRGLLPIVVVAGTLSVLLTFAVVISRRRKKAAAGGVEKKKKTMKAN